ncbi:hypothetical protein GQ53DRAFT_822011 [Thozetella sp. PMI_491]|nr:hypothetical protein GQ53DRAFT_822011 [Thozetella sp. PMI_491]
MAEPPSPELGGDFSPKSGKLLMVCRTCGQGHSLDGPLFQCTDCKWHYHRSCCPSQPNPEDRRISIQSVLHAAPPQRIFSEQAKVDDRMKLQPTDTGKSYISLSSGGDSEDDELRNPRHLNYRRDQTVNTQQESFVKRSSEDANMNKASKHLVTFSDSESLSKPETLRKQRPFENSIPLKQLQPPELRRLAKKVVDEAEFDAIIYSNANAGPPPPGVEIPPLKPRLPPKGEQDRPLYLRFDPRIHYNQPKPEAWYQAKIDEISKRPSRKENFGRAAERWHLANKAKTPATLRQEFVASLPWSIRNDPKWFRARMRLEGYQVDVGGREDEPYSAAKSDEDDNDDDDVIVRSAGKGRRAARKPRRATGGEE